jgi:hypothetical protein
MTVTEPDALWRLLRDEARVVIRSGYLLRRYAPDCVADLFVGIQCPELHEALILRVPKNFAPQIRDLPEMRGLRILSEKLPDDGQDQLSAIVQLREPKYADVFAAFVSVLGTRIGACRDPSDAAQELVGQLVRWHRFLDSHTEGLGEEAQCGLYGELYVLRTLIRETGVQAVRAWSGPGQEPQDFRIAGRIAIEVKTSISVEPQSVRINGERQLDSSGFEHLFLLALSIERTSEAGELLPQVVTDIRVLLKAHAAMAEAFEDLLLEAGYLDKHLQRYSTHGFTVRRLRAYTVTDGFPRLVEADLPAGVGDVSYRLSLAGCRGFEISMESLLGAVKNANSP